MIMLSAQDVLIESGQYFDVKDGDFKTGDILIQNGNITKIGKRINTSSDCIRIQAAGKYIIPGLIDAHIHLFQSGGLYTRPDVVDLRNIKSYDEERSWLLNNADQILRRYLRNGITSIIDVGGPMTNFFLRDKFKFEKDVPNIFITGPLVSTYQPLEFDIDDAPILKVKSVEEARALVQKQAAHNPDFIKIWYITFPQQSAESTYDIVEATIAESHRNNLRVAVHATELNTAKLAIRAGADILVHSVDDKVDDDFIKLLSDNNVTYIPTLIVHGNYLDVLGQTYRPSELDLVYGHPIPVGSLQDVAHLQDNENLNQYKTYAPQLAANLNVQKEQRAKNLKVIESAGINIATGTDAGNIGTHHVSSFYNEIDEMKEAGMTNSAILKASTINAAKAIGKENTLGSIAEMKVGDLVILNENPIDDIQNVRSIAYVIKSGHVFRPDTIVKSTPEQLAQQQLNAYNAGNIDAFLEPYADDVRVYSFPDKLQYQGKELMRKNYADFFKNTPDLHCELVNRMVMGNTVIDQERVTGFGNGFELEAIAIYKIVNGKIAEVYFIQ